MEKTKGESRMASESTLVPVDYLGLKIEQLPPQVLLQAFSALQDYSQKVIQSTLARSQPSALIQEEIKIIGTEISIKEPFYAFRFEQREDRRRHDDHILEQQLYTSAVDEQKRILEEKKKQREQEQRKFDREMRELEDERNFNLMIRERREWRNLRLQRQQDRANYLQEMRHQTELMENMRMNIYYNEYNNDHLGYLTAGIIGGTIGVGLTALLLL